MRRRYLTLLSLAALAGLAALWAWSRPWARASRALDHGDPGLAIEVLTRALSKTPGPAKEEAMRELLAVAHLRKGSVQNAEAEYRALEEKFPDNMEGPLGLGIINLALGRDRFAVEYLEKARALGPRDARPYLILARHHLDRREEDPARRVLFSARERFPEDYRFWELQADLEMSRGRYQAALRGYQAVLSAGGPDPDLVRRMGSAHFYSGDLAQAEALLSKDVKAGDWARELTLAFVWEARGRPEEAAAIYERLFRENEERSQTGIRWALSLARRGRAEEAGRVLDRLEKRLLVGRLENPPAWVNLQDLLRWSEVRRAAREEQGSYELARAFLAAREARYGAAESHARRALSLRGEAFDALGLLAEIARLRGETEDRLQWIGRAVDLYREHPAALLLRAEALLDLKRTPDAIVDARLVADAYPKLSTAQAQLARAWLILGKGGPSLEAAEAAVSLNPADPAAQLAHAEALAALNRRVEAEGAYRDCLKADPYFARARASWGRNLRAWGRSGEAHRQEAEAARLEPMVYGARK